MKRLFDLTVALVATVILALPYIVRGAGRATDFAEAGALLERPGGLPQSHFQNT